MTFEFVARRDEIEAAREAGAKAAAGVLNGLDRSDALLVLAASAGAVGEFGDRNDLIGLAREAGAQWVEIAFALARIPPGADARDAKQVGVTVGNSWRRRKRNRGQ